MSCDAEKPGSARAPTPVETADGPIPPTVPQRTTLPALAAGVATAGPSLVPQEHGGALLSGGKPGNPGHNRYTHRERAQEVRGRLIGQLEGVAGDLTKILETAREADGGRLRCKNCGSYIPRDLMGWGLSCEIWSS